MDLHTTAPGHRNNGVLQANLLLAKTYSSISGMTPPVVFNDLDGGGEVNWPFTEKGCRLAAVFTRSTATHVIIVRKYAFMWQVKRLCISNPLALCYLTSKL